MKNFLINLAMSLLIFVSPALGLQDDIELILRDPFEHSSKKEGFDILGGALAQIDLGYYLLADKNHQWRATVLGDLALINFSKRLHWHFGLAMETLADDQNDIYFRLVQVYYQALTGINWKLGHGALRLGYRHQCNHGTDNAVDSRVTIRSGPTASYAHAWDISNFRLDIEPGINVYVLGQNSDHRSQPKGGSFLIGQAIWHFMDPLALVWGLGIDVELVSEGKKTIYLAWDPMDDWHFEPLFSSRLALRTTRDLVKCDVALAYRQNLDSGFGRTATRNSQLSLEMNFLW